MTAPHSGAHRRSFNRTLWQLTGRQIGHEARSLMNQGMAGSTYWAPVRLDKHGLRVLAAGLPLRLPRFLHGFRSCRTTTHHCSSALSALSALSLSLAHARALSLNHTAVGLRIVAAVFGTANIFRAPLFPCACMLCLRAPSAIAGWRALAGVRGRARARRRGGLITTGRQFFCIWSYSEACFGVCVCVEGWHSSHARPFSTLGHQPCP